MPKLILSVSSYSQSEYTIKGKLIDTLQHPVQDAIVQVLRSSDSTSVSSTFPENDGSFSIALTSPGSYFLFVQMLGYFPYRSEPIVIEESSYQFLIGDIVLRTTGEQFSTVEIATKIPFAQRKMDRVTVTPDAMISNAGLTALEVLEKSPGIQVDLNGNISMNGRQGVIVYIDDKPTYLGSSELAAYLRSLPASTVAYIDIMSTPPAQYDAAGNVGIINIRLKKSKAQGFNGGINLSYGQGFYHRINNSIDFNYRINKFNIFTNLSYGDNNNYQDLTIKRNYFDDDGSLITAFRQNTWIKNESRGASGRLGLDYYPNDKHTFGILTSGFFSLNDSYSRNIAEVKTTGVDFPLTVVAISPSLREFRNGSGNLNYTWNIDTLRQQLMVNIDYSQYVSDLDQSLLSRNYANTDSLQLRTNLISQLPSDIKIATAKLDYSLPLASGSRFDTGAKTSLIQTNNVADFYDEENGLQTINYEFSNRFEYEEKIQAAYINFSKEFEKFSFQTGLRYEHTDIHGYQFGNVLQTDSAFSRKYDSLFPTIYLMYKLDSAMNHVLSLNYGRRIDRPNYQDMNPFTYPLDRFTLYAGNPFLQPTFSHNVELSYTLNNRYTATLMYSDVRNVISETIEQSTSIFYSRPGNIGKQESFGIALSGAAEFTKWWTLQFYTSVNSQTYISDIYGQSMNNSGTFWYIGPTNQFTLNDKWSAEIGGSYQTKVVYAQFLTIPVGSIRAAVAWKCLKNQGSLKLIVNDIFYTNQPGGDIRNLYLSDANWLSYLDTRVVTLAFGYRFNKGQVRNSRNMDGAETEKNRVKNN